jgi:tetratricopeptide (TPR) repeat protein
MSAASGVTRAGGRWRFLVVALALVAAAAIAAYVAARARRGLPAPASDAYEQTVRHFYRGLAGLHVGLVDAARQEIAQAADLAPGEPAAWANLGLAYLRLGDFDGAAPAIERAAALAPSESAVAFLKSRLETSRGRREEAIASLRRAVELDPRGLHARTALIQEVENAGGPDADAEAQRLLEDLFALQPENVAVLVERARLAAKRSDTGLLQDSVNRLEKFAAAWPPEIVERYRALQQASVASNPAEAARATAFLRNVLAREPRFREARARVTQAAELIAEPFARFLRLAPPVATPSAPDTGLSFAREDIGAVTATPWSALTALPFEGDEPPAVFAAGAHQMQRVDAAGPSVPLPGVSGGVPTSPTSLTVLDWNHDFRLDLVAAGPGGVRLFLQSAEGTFADETARASAKSGPVSVDASGAWPADLEMDGDLDVVVGARAAAPVVLRNNGDGTWQLLQPFTGVAGLRGLAWGDVDSDGDPDASLIDGSGALHVFSNLQAGQFQRTGGPANATNMTAIAIGDLNADGVLDLVTLDTEGTIRRASFGTAGWDQDAIATWPELRASAGRGAARVILADLDNNGALDLVASGNVGTGIWLAGEDHALTRLAVSVDAEVTSVFDLARDGQLDLLGLSAGRPVRLTGRGTRGYHHQVVRPRAQTAAGDQRVNSFGIGGEVEVRSGRLVQKQTIAGPEVHVGLGTRTSVDVTRIVWPNGVPQAEFDPGIDQPIVAQQRLKGSCPWIFADDGTGMRFVTDFLWRSPLGLRINAQDTAGVTQTEDWVKIRGDQLVAQDGAYDVRISAELWETHFVDHVSLLAVDHPVDVAVFVDERFAREAPALAVRAMRVPKPVARAWDDTGRDVTDVVSRQDGRYLSTFERGAYQGIATDHFVEFELGEAIPAEGPTWLVAYGFIYPTDSSINVAIGQGGHVVPRGLSLEALDERGRWVIVDADLGFPAGKNKTILVDLSRVARAGAAGARRLRLRTNLEIYWDSLAYAAGVSGVPFSTVRLDARRADLRYRGFSETRADRRDEPEIPIYDRLANTVPRWRDLEGYYTRFGDVRELVAKIEDRYAIMNAGDELRLSFDAPPPPRAGWTRDFVLIGDGWVKDGDYNTSFSKTVLPLPAHGRPEYEASTPRLTLEDDPVYRRFPQDWQTFHTRFVSPRAFLDGLRLAAEARHP